MLPDNAIIRSRQLTIRRELDRRNITLKGVAFDSQIPYPTLLSYFPGERDREPATISGAALFALCGHIPADLISLLLPDGFQIVRAPEDIDHDRLAEAMADYLSVKQHAHHPDSPGGREIAPCEDEKLREQFAIVAGGRAA